MKLYTIGFTKKSAERFFSLLQKPGVNCLVDIRLNPGGQLAGFAKQDDLRYFLGRLIGAEYVHLKNLAPSEEIFKDIKQNNDWEQYTRRFEALMDERNIPESLDRGLFENNICCLLCSEATPEHCHRRLVAERLAKHWAGLEIVHLV
jgi:uncharacterized protein (DUF488 family)